MTYNDIEFGRVSAEEESRKKPELIKNGYYEYKDTINKLWNDTQFLVIGGKGSGKSLVSQKLKSNEDYSRFVTLANMNEFQYKTFKKIMPGCDDVDKNLSYNVAWEFIFCVYAIQSFMRDCGKKADDNLEFFEAIQILKKNGILPITAIGDIVKLCSKRKFSISIPKIGSFTKEECSLENKSLSDSVKMLSKILEKCQSESKHLIVIDGLDHNLSEKGQQFSIIMEMIKAAMSFNDKMADYKVPIKIIILCRSDIYDRLKDPNKNKITRSYMIKLDWYQDQVDAKDSELVKLVEHRASLCGCEKFFEQFFLAKIDEKNIQDYLLENTRYTPRDFIQLLTTLKEFRNTEKFTRQQIENAVKKYSQDYFWNEINDELSGYVPDDQIEYIYTLFRDLGKDTFSLGDLEEKIAQRGEEGKICLENILRVLYDCGALSLVLSNGYYQSRWKNGGSFDIKQKMKLHRATYKALCLE